LAKRENDLTLQMAQVQLELEGANQKVSDKETAELQLLEAVSGHVHVVERKGVGMVVRIETTKLNGECEAAHFGRVGVKVYDCSGGLHHTSRWAPHFYSADRAGHRSDPRSGGQYCDDDGHCNGKQCAILANVDPERSSPCTCI